MRSLWQQREAEVKILKSHGRDQETLKRFMKEVVQAFPFGVDLRKWPAWPGPLTARSSRWCMAMPAGPSHQRRPVRFQSSSRRQWKKGQIPNWDQ